MSCVCWSVWPASTVRAVWQCTVDTQTGTSMPVQLETETTYIHPTSTGTSFLFIHLSYLNLSLQGHSLLWVRDRNLKLWCRAPVNQVDSSKLKISIPQCRSWLSQNYTYQSTPSCTFLSALFTGFCFLSRTNSLLWNVTSCVKSTGRTQTRHNETETENPAAFWSPVVWRKEKWQFYKSVSVND